MALSNGEKESMDARTVMCEKIHSIHSSILFKSSQINLPVILIRHTIPVFLMLMDGETILM